MHPILIGLAIWESAWWFRRNSVRKDLYNQAASLAKQLNKPLVVIGAPDLGSTPGPGTGDLIVDIRPSKYSNSIVCDITKGIPLADNSCVVFVSCVLEYVNDYTSAAQEIQRVSGGNYFIATVEPW